MTRALVTGAAGFVGANLARRLLADGWEVDLAVGPESDSWRLEAVAADNRLHRVDLTDAAAVENVLAATQPSHVFHLAAHGAYSWQTDAQRILATNILGTLNVLESSLLHGCEAFVNTGSSSEYGFKDHAPPEDELPEPNSVYAVAKVAATMFAGHHGRVSEARISTLRLYSVYGPYEEPRRLVPNLVSRALEGRLPPLADPAIVRDFVHVDDVVAAYLVAAAAATGGAVYNVGSGAQTSLAELVEVAREVFSLAEEPSWGSMAPRSWDTTTWVAATGKIRSELGWEPRVSLADGLRAFGDWLAAAPELRARYASASV
jgi:nucleoside-diphosphate-sugar epimerase